MRCEEGCPGGEYLSGGVSKSTSSGSETEDIGRTSLSDFTWLVGIWPIIVRRVFSAGTVSTVLSVWKFGILRAEHGWIVSPSPEGYVRGPPPPNANLATGRGWGQNAISMLECLITLLGIFEGPQSALHCLTLVAAAAAVSVLPLVI